MLSHSCTPNTHHTIADDMTMVMLAATSIPAGQQITGNYTIICTKPKLCVQHWEYFPACIKKNLAFQESTPISSPAQLRGENISNTANFSTVFAADVQIQQNWELISAH